MGIFGESEHEDDPYICAACGNCTMVCPVFRQMKWESYGPRGRLQNIKKILGKKGSLDEDYSRKMLLCSLCGHCTSVCTTSIRLDRLWIRARTEIWERGISSAPVRFSFKSLENYGDPFTMGPSTRTLWMDDLDSSVKDRIGKPAELLYFIGCNIGTRPQFQNVAQSMVKILEYADVDYTLLGEKEVCCGALFLWGGDRENAAKIMTKNIEAMEKLNVKKILFSCPSCQFTWQTSYQEILGINISEKYQLVSSSRFISELNRDKKLEYEEQPMVTVTYHDPCISVRKLNIQSEPREVIDRIPGIYNVDMLHSKEDTRCCGNHGLLALSDPLLSSQIAERRLREISVTPASRVITECPECVRAFDLATATSGYDVQVQSLSQLVAESLKEKTNESGEDS
ncbi:MAG: (Fe-S)-binding protein [Candidatus Thorarchaeota archaeon]